MPGTAIVTGASRGIGRAIALRLSKDGFRVALNDLASSKDALEGVKSDILESGGMAEVFYADVSNEDDVQTMVADVTRIMGGVDVVSHATASLDGATPIHFIETDGRQCWNLHNQSAY
jgi:NAD(P)-dependent dehydrogenase (short-subunit alcohol dehydrogenase family)